IRPRVRRFALISDAVEGDRAVARFERTGQEAEGASGARTIEGDAFLVDVRPRSEIVDAAAEIADPSRHPVRVFVARHARAAHQSLASDVSAEQHAEDGASAADEG